MSWTFASPQRTPVHGGRDFPSVRYSASAVEYRGELIVTHGYFYNHQVRHPGWQSNAWAFNFASRKWRKIHEGEQAGAPSARYSCSAVLYDNALYMYGGDDGGHKHSMFNYVFQAWFTELWRFDLRAYSWQQVRPKGKIPPKRALHGAVAVGDSMYVYGGLELADTWRYDFIPQTWTLLVPPPADTDTKDGSHPGRRHAFAMAAAGQGFFVFGGCRHVRGMRPLAFDDLWHFDISTNTWTKKEPPAESPAHPSARSHLSLVRLSSNLLMLYGGALCIPGCSCYGDSWLYKINANSWHSLNATNAPIHRFVSTALCPRPRHVPRHEHPAHLHPSLPTPTLIPPFTLRSEPRRVLLCGVPHPHSPPPLGAGTAKTWWCTSVRAPPISLAASRISRTCTTTPSTGWPFPPTSRRR